MHRSEESLLDRCVDCGAELRPAQEAAFCFGTTGVLCAACAQARGGRYDSRHDRWEVAPDYRDLEAEFR